MFLAFRHGLLGRRDTAAAETAALQIDRLVYKLYSLTPEEVAVVEDTVKL